MGLGQVKFWNPYINCKESCEGMKKCPNFITQSLRFGKTCPSPSEEHRATNKTIGECLSGLRSGLSESALVLAAACG